jgi:adenylylsulfate kinase
MSNNIHSVFDQILGREEKERFLGQQGCVLWFTGLSGAGKTTIACCVERELASRGILTQVLDGDNIRSGLNKNLHFDPESRMENIRRIAEVSKLFVNCGVVTLNCFISPERDMRTMACDIIGKNNFFEIYVDASLEICEMRDIKGLYRKARTGEIPNFTGIHQKYEAPENPTIHLRTDIEPVESCVRTVVDVMVPKIKAQ